MITYHREGGDWKILRRWYKNKKRVKSYSYTRRSRGPLLQLLRNLKIPSLKRKKRDNANLSSGYERFLWTDALPVFVDLLITATLNLHGFDEMESLKNILKGIFFLLDQLREILLVALTGWKIGHKNSSEAWALFYACEKCWEFSITLKKLKKSYSYNMRGFFNSFLWC